MASNGNMSSRDIPQPMDIILGRGKSYSKHPGNIVFQDLIRTNRLRYFESSFAGKRSIIDEVIHKIQSKGGRFVRMKDKGWSIIPSKACRLKIAHAIQYHIRTEFSQGMNVQALSNITDDMTTACSGTDEQLSYHTRIVEELHAKLSWLQAQQAAREMTRSYRGIGNNSQLHPYNSSVHQTESIAGEKVGEKRGRESPSTTGIHYNVVSPLAERKVAQSFLASCDSDMKDKHVNGFPAENMNARPEWMNELDRYYDARESCLQDKLPSKIPKFGLKTAMRPFRPVAQLKSTRGDSASAHMTASVPVFTDMMDQSQNNLYPTESFCNPISERASSYYYHYYMQKYGPQNQYPNGCSANVIDTPTSPSRLTQYVSSGKSEIQVEFTDEGKASHFSTLDGDFDLFPIDLTRDLDPFPMHGVDDLTDERVDAQTYHP